MDKDLCSQRAYILVVPGMGFTTHNMLVSETLLNTDEPKIKYSKSQVMVRKLFYILDRNVLLYNYHQYLALWGHTD